nr:hypothetical protein Itr_chr13CG18410 [Ipomoea trifida]
MASPSMISSPVTIVQTGLALPPPLHDSSSGTFCSPPQYKNPQQEAYCFLTWKPTDLVFQVGTKSRILSSCKIFGVGLKL